ncbi:hypothetical protein BDZ94DRAFT_1257051 [Collybia nuda]|uniref:Uncharacterized protein n=1 Tax=Collybia nuda TaxID=64659 RepID=A0A9P5Y5T8_9AGAR|nr:hypothetical protein BDZ94DRAFT_1257051 [Collybia nuda]
MFVNAIIMLTTFICMVTAAVKGEEYYDGSFTRGTILSTTDICPSHSTFRRKTPLWIVLGKHSPVEIFFKDRGDGKFSCLYQDKNYPGRPRRSDITLAYCHYDSYGNIDREGFHPGRRGSHVDCPRRAHMGVVVPSRNSRLERKTGRTRRAQTMA